MTYRKTIKTNLLAIAIVLFSGLLLNCNTGEDNAEASPSLSGDPVMLKLNLQDGQEFASLVDVDYSIKTSAMGQEMNMLMNMKTDYTIRAVKDDEEGNEVLDLITDRVKVKLDTGMGMGNMDFDSQDTTSTDPQAEVMAEMMEKFIGTPLSITFNRQGGMEKMDGMEGIMEEIEASSGGMASAQFEQMFGGAVNQNFQSYFAILPSKEVQIGETWEHEVTGQVQAYPLIIRNTYKLVDRNNGVAMIEVKSDLSLDSMNLDKEKMKEQTMGMDFEIEMSGTQDGTMEVDETSGWTKSSTINQDIDMKMIIGGMEMPMEMKGVIKFGPRPE